MGFQKGYIPWNKGKTGIKTNKIGGTSPMKGKYHTKEAKRKMSEKRKGKKAWNKGIPSSEESKRKMSISKKGKISSFKGKKHTEESKRKMSISMKGRISHNKGKKYPYKPRIKMKNKMVNDKHHQWKADKVGYYPLHSWIKRKLGKPDHCDNLQCIYPRKDKRSKIMLIPKRYVWANISGEYKRDLSDWHQLCNSCNLNDGIKVAKRFLNYGSANTTKSNK